MGEVIVKRDGAIGTVVLSNPAKFNAMSRDMWAAVPAAIAELDADSQIRVVVLQGDGDRAFVSGADISQFESQRSDPESQRAYNDAVQSAYSAPVACSKPVIAKVRGVCMGGGLGLAAACDLRICSSDARFRMPAGRMGLGYGIDGVRRFMALIGVQNTYDIFFSARIFDAAEALRMGFVMRVTDPASLDDEVGRFAAGIAENAPLTLRALKTTVNALLDDPEDRDAAGVQAAIDTCFRSEDYREGARAFMEKRPARFTGR